MTRARRSSILTLMQSRLLQLACALIASAALNSFAAAEFVGAPEPKKSSKPSPLTPQEERAEFTLPPGFEIELVASEDLEAQFGKFVTVDWDQHGNLWTMTALEYPVDANESPEVAKQLYASRARDKVLVFDRDAKSPRGYASKPSVFADGLAIPLGILPYKNGAYVQHGPDIVFLSDTNGDGRADKREVILTGFGVQDSHLFPHQFTRAPGNWLWMAQGAFNYGKVKTTRGAEVQFDQTRMAKFRPDGSDFDITSQGPCNIWGLHMTMEGETWIQEANDFGYPAMPFHEYANYPGCSGGQWKSYAPEFPGTANFRMGGTGLSGLAISDKNTWPAPYADVIYIANPITRKINAIKAHPDGPRWKLEHLPEFVQSSDEMFRPVALRLGPDGCLYFVDWYNKIISHNEVPRNHPERDKKRGRIWRVKHRDVKPLDVPDFAKLSGDELITKLGGENTTQSHLAWQAIIDRQLSELTPKLKRVMAEAKNSPGKRVAALWALQGLKNNDRFRDGAEFLDTLRPFLADSDRNLRREAVRVLGVHFPSIAGASGQWTALFNALGKLTDDPDPQVRSELIKTLATTMRVLPVSSDSRMVPMADEHAFPLLAKLARPSLDAPTMKSTHSGKIIKTGEAYEREFERYLVRLMLERGALGLDLFLASPNAKSLPIENRLLLALALEPKVSAARVAELLPALQRPPNSEELLRLAQFPDATGAADALKKALQQPTAIESLLQVRTKFDAAKITPLLTDIARSFWADNQRELALRLTSSFKLAGMESEINEALLQDDLTSAQKISMLRTIRELGANELMGILIWCRSPESEVAHEAIGALAASRNRLAAEALYNKFWNDFPASEQRFALSLVTATKPGATATVKAVRSGRLRKDDLDAAALEKLQAVLGNDAELAALLNDMASVLQPALHFYGKRDTFVWTKYKLAGPFTVECWLKLDPGINNQDGILAGPGQLDLNFHDSTFRVWVGGAQHDIIVAKHKTVPDVWTHYAVTRDAQGVFRIYINGELDATSTGRNTNTFENLDVGRTNPNNGGTAGWMNEFRLWNFARTPEQIRAEFDHTYSGETGIGGGGEQRGARLVSLLTGTQWPSLHGSVKIEKTMDLPPILDATAAAEFAQKFKKFRALTAKRADVAHGKDVFKTTCMTCHSVGGEGAQVGPVLNGAGASGIESILRNVLTPNAAMEAGYRMFRVELKDGDVLDGLLVSQDKDAIVLRRPNVADERIPMNNVRRADYTRRSMMPDGLLEALPERDAADLLAYLQTLK
jgi:putative membrane-bound dehydrogenase-like protein